MDDIFLEEEQKIEILKKKCEGENADEAEADPDNWLNIRYEDDDEMVKQ